MITAHMTKFLWIPLLSLSVIQILGCGGSESAVLATAPLPSSSPSPSPNPSPAPAPTPAPTPSPTPSTPPAEFLLEGNSTSSLNVTQIDLNSGILGGLTPAAPSTNAADNVIYPGVAVTPAKKLLYALSSSLASTQGFAISGPGLILTPLAHTPFASGSSGSMNSLVLHPSGRFLYIIHSPATIEGQTVNLETGDLTFVANFTAPATANLNTAVIDPTGTFLYAPDLTGAQIFGYRINQADGSLSAVPGSPFPLPAGNLPSIEAIDSTGRFLYVSLTARGVAAFSIDSTTGTLGDVPGSPFATSGAPVFLAADPVANFIYLCNSDGSIDCFAIEASAGTLTPVQGSPFATAATAGNVAVDPLGKFVYVSNELRSAIFAFAIDSASGSLMAIPGSPFAAVPQVENLYIVKLP